MAVNKVVFGNDTLIDLTEDTVQPEDVAMGETFHDRSGALRTGTSSGTGGVPIELLEDTVGWTGKNRFPITLENLKVLNTSGTWNGNVYTYGSGTLTCEVDINEYITKIHADGSFSSNVFYFDLDADFDTIKYANYLFNGLPSNGSNTTFSFRICTSVADRTSVQSIVNNNTAINNNGQHRVFSLRFAGNYSLPTGGLDFYPMIRLASISNDTFEPYHESVENVLQDAEVTPSKNLISFPYNRDNGYTSNGVVYTLDSEHRVIPNRTSSSTSNAMFRLNYITNPTNAEIDYYAGKILNGCPSGGSDTTYNIEFNAVVNNSTLVVCKDYGEGVTIPSDLSAYYGATAIYIGVFIYKSYSPSNLIFAPMLRDASKSDPTYKPYYIPLKDRKVDNDVLAPVENNTTASQGYNQGSPFMRFGKWCIAKTNIASGETLTEGTNYEVGNVGDNLKQVKEGVTLTSAASAFTDISLDSASDVIVKYGKIVTGAIKVNIANDITLSSKLNLIKLNYLPYATNELYPLVTVYKGTEPYGIETDYAFYIDSSGNIRIPVITWKAGNYILAFNFICK